jgi:hypothetical protein
MWFRTLFDALLARSSRTLARQRRHTSKDHPRPRSFRPLLDVLEDRTLLSGYTVNSLTDAGAGSGVTGDLRYCITNATSGNDTITFGVTGTIKLESALPALNASVAIQGPGAGQLTVERDPSSVSSFLIFAVGSAATVQISGLTIANGSAGAIANAGTLSVSNSTLSGNTNSGGGGGTIYNSGALSVSNSTLSGNTSYSSFSSGGAIYNETGTLTVSNSTLSGNTVYGAAGYSATGGSIVMAAGRLSLSSSTLCNNTVIGGSYFYWDPDSPYIYPNGGAWIGDNAYGGGLYVFGGTVSIDHSTLAGNQAIGGYSDPGYQPGYSAGDDIFNGLGQSALQIYDTILDSDLFGGFTSLGHNLIGNTVWGSGFAATDLLNVNPQLGPLQDNGGPTQTMALLASSPAINAGDNTGAPAYDQRGVGFPRIVGGTIDIGAFEVQNISGLAVSGFPATTTAGIAGSFTVTAKNADGATDANYTGTVHFTSSDAKAVLPANYTFTAADAGVHTFSATLKTAGTQSFTATDTTTASLSGSDAGITVNPAAASTTMVAGFPSTTTAGVAGNFTVTLKDPYGNIAAGYAGTMHFTSSDAKAVLPANYTFTAADAGVHTFSTTLKSAGTQSITATDTITGSLTATEGGITVNPAAASQFVISAPSSITAGVPFSLTLMVKDAYGNVVTGYTGTIHFSNSEPRATLPANYTFTTADKGVHTFTGLVLRKKGTQKITVTDTLNSSLTGSVTENVL